MRRPRLLLVLSLLVPGLLAPALVPASALGDLEQAAGRSADSVYVPEPQGSPVGVLEFHTDPNASGEVWYLQADCSSCPRSWYPDPYPKQGPYSSRSACEGDLQAVKNRPGASSCESYTCVQGGSGGGAGGADSGGGSGAANAATTNAIRSGVQDALATARAVAARNNGDTGKDLLAEGGDDDDRARYGIGRETTDGHGFSKLGDGPLQVLILKLEPWCQRPAPKGKGAAAKAAAQAAELEKLLAQTRSRLDEADVPFNQRQRTLLKLDCGDATLARLRDAAAEAPPKAKAKSEAPAPAAAADEGLGSTPQLLREPEKLGRPYVDCATWRQDAGRLRAGLAKQRETIAKTEALLRSADSGAAKAGVEGRDKALSFAKDEVVSAAKDYLGKVHAAEKSLSYVMRKAQISRQDRLMLLELKDQLQKTKERAESMQAAAEKGSFEWRRFSAAGGVRGYMGDVAERVEQGARQAVSDPALRESLLSSAGEGLASLGGPAGAFAFRAAKTDIDLTALAVSQGLDQKEAAQHRQTLGVLKDQLSRSEERIKFLEEEGSAQCKDRP